MEPLRSRLPGARPTVVALVVAALAAGGSRPARATALGFAALADAPVPSKTAAAAVRTALGQVGKPYRWGGTGPATFDCSGLTRCAYAQRRPDPAADLTPAVAGRPVWLRRGHPPREEGLSA